jgi:hypothetical protein
MRFNHLRFCLFLVFLGLPIFLLDHFLLGGKSEGGRYRLNFEGLLIGSYALFATVHILVSTIAVFILKKSGLVLLHLGAAFLSVLLIVSGFFLYPEITRKIKSSEFEAELSNRKSRMNVIELKEWWYVPNKKNLQEIYVRVVVKESGRFTGDVIGFGKDSSGMKIPVLSSTDREEYQRQVRAGEDFIYVFPLRTLKKEYPLNDVEIDLYLFNNEYKQQLDIRKFYASKIETEDDGTFFYALLPKPSETNYPKQVVPADTSRSPLLVPN